MIRTLTLSGLFLLLASAAAGAGPLPDTSDAARSLDPRGLGDPAAITCRIPQHLPGSRLRGPEVCQSNRVWAALNIYRGIILPDGQTLVATDLKSDACGSERIAGVTALIRLGNARTFYRCDY
jgi:hypothetical protein